VNVHQRIQHAASDRKSLDQRQSFATANGRTFAQQGLQTACGKVLADAKHDAFDLAPIQGLEERMGLNGRKDFGLGLKSINRVRLETTGLGQSHFDLSLITLVVSQHGVLVAVTAENGVPRLILASNYRGARNGSWDVRNLWNENSDRQSDDPCGGNGRPAIQLKNRTFGLTRVFFRAIPPVCRADFSGCVARTSYPFDACGFSTDDFLKRAWRAEWPTK
jgi:hypothetical protein